jgi:rSAM/selenodomain-associated transferase 2
MSEKQRPSVSIIIPTFNEASCLQQTLDAIARVRGNFEVIVVDGGSDDSTIEIARRAGARVIECDRGRGIQMHSGALIARGQALLFLHADTILPREAVVLIENCLSDDQLTAGGNFEIRFDGETRAARFMTWLYPRLGQLGLYYGDSAIFVRAAAYERAGGFKPFPIFEDVNLVQRLKRMGRMKHLPVVVMTSSRRFENRRFVFTFLRWSMLQVLYWLGVSPMKLGRLYGRGRDASTKNVIGFQSRDTLSCL